MFSHTLPVSASLPHTRNFSHLPGELEKLFLFYIFPWEKIGKTDRNSQPDFVSQAIWPSTAASRWHMGTQRGRLWSVNPQLGHTQLQGHAATGKILGII